MDPTDGGLNWSSHAFGPMSPFATESSRSAQPSCLALCGLLAKMLLVPEVRSFERELMGFREDFLHLLIELSNPGTPRTFQLFLSCSFLGQPQGPRGGLLTPAGPDGQLLGGFGAVETSERIKGQHRRCAGSPRGEGAVTGCCDSGQVALL